MEWIKIFDSKEDVHAKLNQSVFTHFALNGKSICIVMRQGALYAFENKCPHNGESLSKGSINYLGEIVCPWHGYRFNIKTGRECAERCRDLETFPIEEKEEGFFVGLDVETDKK